MTDKSRSQHVVLIRRLTVHASEDPQTLPVEEAWNEASAGDGNWREMLIQLQRGDAAIVELRTLADVEVDGVPERIEIVNHGVWVERDLHPPKIEEQVRELAYKDVAPLHKALLERGVDLPEDELSEMFFHVEVDDGLLLDAGPQP